MQDRIQADAQQLQDLVPGFDIQNIDDCGLGQEPLEFQEDIDISFPVGDARRAMNYCFRLQQWYLDTYDAEVFFLALTLHHYCLDGNTMTFGMQLFFINADLQSLQVNHCEYYTSGEWMRSHILML